MSVEELEIVFDLDRNKIKAVQIAKRYEAVHWASFALTRLLVVWFAGSFLICVCVRSFVSSPDRRFFRLGAAAFCSLLVCRSCLPSAGVPRCFLFAD
jgi:hypothetical protein